MSNTPGPVADWGQNVTSLDGYVVKGGFAKDLETFFAHEEKDGGIDEDAARAEKLFTRLPEPHRTTAFALDRLVRNGEWRSLRTAQINGYGFDCVKNDLYGMAEEQYFGLAYNDFGDLFLLNVDSGAVHTWVSDSDPIDDTFASLDAWAWAVVRLELANRKRVPKADLTPVFERLGVGFAAPQAD